MGPSPRDRLMQHRAHRLIGTDGTPVPPLEPLEYPAHPDGVGLRVVVVAFARGEAQRAVQRTGCFEICFGVEFHAGVVGGLRSGKQCFAQEATKPHTSRGGLYVHAFHFARRLRIARPVAARVEWTHRNTTDEATIVLSEQDAALRRSVLARKRPEFGVEVLIVKRERQAGGVLAKQCSGSSQLWWSLSGNNACGCCRLWHAEG
jgi:hypothetical protein